MMMETQKMIFVDAGLANSSSSGYPNKPFERDFPQYTTYEPVLFLMHISYRNQRIIEKYLERKKTEFLCIPKITLL